MRWMRASYSTLAARVEQLFWGLHSIAVAGLSVWMALNWSELALANLSLIAIGGYLCLLVGLFLYARNKAWRFARVLWPICILDLAGIAGLIHVTGGIESDFYLLLFAVVPFMAFHQGLRAGLISVVFVCVGYFFTAIAGHGIEAVPDFVFRSAMLTMLTAATGLSAQVIRQSENRLLSALDKLNERTTELERTHTQLETIYETARSLAELMAFENVISRALNIAQAVLNYPVCELYTYDALAGRLLLQGHVDSLDSIRLDKPREVELGEPFRRVIEQGEKVRVVDRHVGRQIIDGNPHRSQLIVPLKTEGKIIGLLSVASPNPNAFSERDERVLEILASSTAMALVNADLHQRMEKLTIIDELTGVYNFRYFRSRLEDERRRAVRYGQPLSLVMVDIDWFKRLNDQYGHETGNIALRELAKVITTCIRDVDILARYGGEEFIVILPQTGVEEAHAIGERIRRRVEHSNFGVTPLGDVLRMTVSIGISCYPDNGKPEDALVESVDQALYRAKDGGKNLVCTS